MERRTLSWKSYTNRASFALFVTFLIIALIATPFLFIQWRETSLLSREGIDTTGVIVNRATETRRRNNSTSTRTVYYLTLRFQAQDGSSHETRFSVGQSEYNQTSTGMTLPMRYAASDPEVTERAAGDTRRNAMIMSLFGASAVIGALISLIYVLKGAGQMRRALNSGQTSTAYVTEHIRAKRKNSPLRAAKWSDGSRSGTTLWMSEGALPAIGSEITILVDPWSNRGWPENQL